MKTNNRKKTSGPTPTVTVQCSAPNAAQVCIAGSFNDWDPICTPLARNGDGQWRTVLDLPPGRYEYRLIADGVWIDPPEAVEMVENPFGSRNAVLHVPSGATSSGTARAGP
jgi:1,4-alpha-glucan branching enzyme